MLFPQKTIQKLSKPRQPTLKFPHIIQYSRNFHKNRSTTQFKSHFKIIHSNKNSHRGESLSHNTTTDVIEQIKAYALKLQVLPLTEKVVDCMAPKGVKSGVTNLQIHFSSHRSSSEMKEKKKDEKLTNHKCDSKVELILPKIREVKQIKTK